MMMHSYAAAFDFSTLCIINLKTHCKNEIYISSAYILS